MNLVAEVEALVNGKMAVREPFTIVDISHVLIAQDCSVRHGDVKKVINDMQARGDFRNADYRVGKVSVEPKPGETATARLFYPNGTDPDDYKAVTQELKRPTNLGAGLLGAALQTIAQVDPNVGASIVQAIDAADPNAIDQTLPTQLL